MLNEAKGTMETTTVSRSKCSGSVLPNAATSSSTLNCAVKGRSSEVSRPSSPKGPILSAPLFTKKLKSDGAKFNDGRTEDKQSSGVVKKGTENSGGDTNVAAADVKKAVSLSKIESTTLETNQHLNSCNSEKVKAGDVNQQPQCTRPSNPFLKSSIK